LLPPYFDHDAFTHHALHILDAPGYTGKSKGDTKAMATLYGEINSPDCQQFCKYVYTCNLESNKLNLCL